MTIRPNFPLTAETMAVFALTFTGRREHVTRIVALQDATLRLEAITACPREQAHRIAVILGAEATEGLTDTVARSGVTLGQIAAAFTNPEDYREPGSRDPAWS